VASPDAEQRLTAVLTRAQTEGALGTWPIAEVINHAREFVAALPDEVVSVLDLGTGAGVPGLIVALERPTVRVTLVDRRAKRIDALQRAIVGLGWADRVVALVAEATELTADPAWSHSQDAVVARGFGAPELTLGVAARLTRVGGWVVISEPPTDHPSRWDVTRCAAAGVGAPERLGRVVRFHVEQRVAPREHPHPRT
jgi:16S rRNA (guanine527-N7)-methyltransferase